MLDCHWLSDPDQLPGQRTLGEVRPLSRTSPSKPFDKAFWQIWTQIALQPALVKSMRGSFGTHSDEWCLKHLEGPVLGAAYPLNRQRAG